MTDKSAGYFLETKNCLLLIKEQYFIGWIKKFFFRQVLD